MRRLAYKRRDILWKTFIHLGEGIIMICKKDIIIPKIYERRYRSKQTILKVYLAIVVVLFIVTLDLILGDQSRKTKKQCRTLEGVKRRFPSQSGVNYSQYQLNVQLSNSISLTRVIEDTRPDGCGVIDYKDDTLPSVSIVIPFHNEAWSMLLRSLHSIINRTPLNLIKEIILMDDCSDYDYLKDPLEEYVSLLSHKIHILRNAKREGLIRARSKAARSATGEVLVFLDAHVECNTGWIQPLLNVIKRNSTTIAVPQIDNINPDSIHYKPWKTFAQGAFQWNMEYVWKTVPFKAMTSHTDTFNTATMIGCAFAVSRAYFFKLGGYDEDMYIWGGENLELSFRTWMCGGSMVIVPCSRVGHVFRNWLPYSFPEKYGGRFTISKNYQRVVDVWLDEYKMFYFASVQNEITYTKEDILSLQKRIDLRKRLQCKSFNWYLQTVIPDIFIPRRIKQLSGQLKNMQSISCASGEMVSPYNNIPMMYCGMYSQDQMFSYMDDLNRIVHGTKCLAAITNQEVSLATCDNSSSQKWHRQVDSNSNTFHNDSELAKEFSRFTVNVEGSSLCLSQILIDHSQYLGLHFCLPPSDPNVNFQFWSIGLSFDFDIAKSILDRRK